MSNTIRVFCVDDSVVFRNFLTQTIGSDDRFEIVGTAVDAYDAQKQIPQLMPDVITLDIEMPGMNGLEFLKELLPKHPIPVVLVSSLSLRVFDALAAGAIDYIRKPDFSVSGNKELFASTLRSKVAIASRSKVRIPAVRANSAAANMAQKQEEQFLKSATATLSQRLAGNKIIAIGASTGGTEATLAVVKSFPANMPGVVITQHMPAGFTAMYAERLNRICKMEVREAKNGDQVRQGLMLIAPGGYQMRVVKMGSGYTVKVTEEDRVNGHAPSVDVLFNSVAQAAHGDAIGVILTGMGADGAAGLLRMRQNGAYTIGQDKETCVVYGMPMEAYKIGGVCAQASLLNIPSLIYKQLGF